MLFGTASPVAGFRVVAFLLAGASSPFLAAGHNRILVAATPEVGSGRACFGNSGTEDPREWEQVGWAVDCGIAGWSMSCPCGFAGSFYGSRLDIGRS